MGRKLMRVPLDFAHPVGEIWPGFLHPYPTCEGCEDVDDEDQATWCKVHRPPWKELPPPVGEGFQLWEDTSEGSPISPVFSTLDDLCRYAAEHCTTFGRFTATAEKWRAMLSGGFVGHQDGPFFFC